MHKNLPVGYNKLIKDVAKLKNKTDVNPVIKTDKIELSDNARFYFYDFFYKSLCTNFLTEFEAQ